MLSRSTASVYEQLAMASAANVQVDGSNVISAFDKLYRMRIVVPGFAICNWRSARPTISLVNTSAKIIDDGSNCFQNAIEKLTYPDAQLVSLGAKNAAGHHDASVSPIERS